MKYLKRYKKEELWLLTVLLAGAVLQVITPRFLSGFIDTAMGDGAYWNIVVMITGFLLCSGVQKAMDVLGRFLTDSLQGKFVNSVRHDMLAHFFRLESREYEKYSSGELLIRIDEDTEGVFQFYKVLLVELGGSGLILAGVLLAVGRQELFLAVSLLILCLLTIWVFKRITDFGTKCYVRSNRAQARYNGLMKDRLDNLLELHFADARDSTLAGMEDALKILFEECLPAGLMYGRLWSMSTILDMLVNVVVLLAIVMLWDRGLISLGTAFLLYQYVQLVYEPLQNFRERMGALQDARAKKIRVEEFLGTKEEAPISGKGLSLSVSEEKPSAKEERFQKTEKIERIEVCDLHFAYEGRGVVLNGITFTICAGEHIGLAGETGCGKSTLAKILAGFYRASAGSIYINGKDINGSMEGDFREKIVYCPQKVQILHTTIRNNITLFDRGISDERIFNALKELGLYNWMTGFEKGLDTFLEEGEKSLSSGEAQLLSIVRVFVRNPEVMILDEVTANLDKESEKRVAEAMEKATTGRTVVAIMHHPELLKQMDRIIWLQGK